MRVFCDTNVLIAASVAAHVHHTPAKAVLERICRGDDSGYTSAHSLAETFSVLSRMPTVPKLMPQDVLAILEKNILPHFTLVALVAADYPETIRALTAKGFGGGRIYDLLHLVAARKLALDRIYTFNESEWKSLARDLEPLIATPPAVTTT
jgi:predicted nucleic acid-binding protein